MVKRICPNCGTANYSADTRYSWICYECGAKVPRPKKEDKKEVNSNGS